MAPDAAITVADLHFTYQASEILHGLTFQVHRGQVTGLLGPNGAGKSTTLRILIGILEPGSGQVVVEGCALPEQALALKRRVGYVPEAAELYDSLTAEEFLELCGRLHEIDESTLQRRIGSFLAAFGLEDARRQRLGAFSKGMRQKTLLSAALIHDPSLLVLDEPLTGLDTDAAALIKQLLSSLAAAGKTVLYSSHVLDVVERVCDRVLILDRGRLIAEGSPDELKSAARAGTLEQVFRTVTHAEDVGPRVASILAGLAR